MPRIAAIMLVWAGCLPDPGGFTDAAPIEGPPYTGFANPEHVTIRGYTGDAMEPFLTRDGAYLLFNNSNAPGVDTNLMFARRVSDLVFDYGGEIAGANSSSLDGVASVDRDGHLYFVSPRAYDATQSTIYRGDFAYGGATDVALAPGVSRHEALVVNFDVEISPDGGTMYFVDGVIDPGAPAPKHADLVIADRTDGTGFTRRADSAEVMANINSAALEYAAAISVDQLEMFFDRVDLSRPDPSPAISRTTRTSIDAPFDIPSRVTGATGFVEGATVSPDGTALYYHHREDDGHFAIERVTRRPYAFATDDSPIVYSY